MSSVPLRQCPRWGCGDYRSHDSVATPSNGVADPIAWGDGGATAAYAQLGYHAEPTVPSGGLRCGLSTDIHVGHNDIPSTLDAYFEGPWYEQPERYIRMSRWLRESYDTPRSHASRHPCASTQGTRFSAIKRKGVPAEMVVYLANAARPDGPKFVLDIMNAT